jgi:hypothetical protein
MLLYVYATEQLPIDTATEQLPIDTRDLYHRVLPFSV